MSKLAVSEVKIFIIFEPLSKDKSFIGGYNFYHSLEGFSILNNRFTAIHLDLKNSAWDDIPEVRSKAIIWMPKDCDLVKQNMNN